MAKKGMKRPENTEPAAQNQGQSGAQSMARGAKGKSELSSSPERLPASGLGGGDLFAKKLFAGAY